MATTRELTVIKVPRNDAILDKKISFAPLHNLHLDLMEVKGKLKKGLPVVIIKPPPTTAPPTAAVKPPARSPQRGPPPSVVIKPALTPAIVPMVQPPKVAPVELEIDFDEDEAPEDNFEEEDLDDGVGEDEDDFGEEGEDEVVDDEEDGDDFGEEEGDDEDESVMLKELGGEDRQGGNEKADFDDGDETPRETPTHRVDHPHAGPPVPQPLVEHEPDPHEGMTAEEIDTEEKEEYIWRFKILKKKYKDREIPTFNEHDDLPMMKSTYKRLIREIGFENNVGSYKTYMVGSFVAMEVIFTQFLGVTNMAGFAGEQTANIDQYDSMIVELGEKQYTRFGTSLPVEIRLLGFIMMQAGVFYACKLLGDGAGNLIKMMFGIKPAKPSDPEQPARKMRGPSIRASDMSKKRADDSDDEG